MNNLSCFDVKKFVFHMLILMFSAIVSFKFFRDHEIHKVPLLINLFNERTETSERDVEKPD